MKYLKCQSVFLLWTCFTIFGLESLRSGLLEITNITCETFDANFMEPPKCLLLKRKDQRVFLSFYGKLNQRINNMTVFAKLLHLVNKKYQPFLYEDQIDFCEFLATAKRHMLWGMIYEMVQKNSNINHTCPYDDALIVNNFMFEGKQFKLLPLPKGKYEMEFILEIGDVPKAKFDVLVEKT